MIDRIVGLDLGLLDIVVSSNGLATSNPRFMAKASVNVRRKQRKLSRKEKSSKRRVDARLLVAKAHEKVAAVRSHFQHVLTKQLVDENQAIVVEDLTIKGMVKNKRLAKAIIDASWHSLINKLEYKLAIQGKYLIRVDRFYPSTKICNSCGLKQEMKLGQRMYRCVCGWQAARDMNAALNIRNQGIEKLKAAGYTVSARGGLCKTSSEAVACET
jgi:putative transposase